MFDNKSWRISIEDVGDTDVSVWPKGLSKENP